jgi:serine/threonine protein kinase/uncharacterized membrane protein
MSTSAQIQTGPDGTILGSVIDDRYQIESYLGEGAMGAVFKAIQLRLRRPVAFKVPLPVYMSDEGFRQRFEREALAMAKVHHENVVGVHDVNVAKSSGEISYLVLEYVEGKDLDIYLREQETNLTVGQVLELFHGIAKGLQSAHAAPIVHRDIKPSNIIVTQPQGVAKVLDFGVARIEDSDYSTMTASAVGTPLFMAPEQVSADTKVTPAADIYAFAMTLYREFGRDHAFMAKNSRAMMYAQVHTEPRPLTELNPNVTPGAAEIINKGLAKEPEDRYQDATELMIDLKKAMAGKEDVPFGAFVPPEDKIPPILRQSRKNPESQTNLGRFIMAVTPSAAGASQQPSSPGEFSGSTRVLERSVDVEDTDSIPGGHFDKEASFAPTLPGKGQQASDTAQPTPNLAPPGTMPTPNMSAAADVPAVQPQGLPPQVSDQQPGLDESAEGRTVRILGTREGSMGYQTGAGQQTLLGSGSGGLSTVTIIILVVVVVLLSTGLIAVFFMYQRSELEKTQQAMQQTLKESTARLEASQQQVVAKPDTVEVSPPTPSPNSTPPTTSLSLPAIEVEVSEPTSEVYAFLQYPRFSEFVTHVENHHRYEKPPPAFYQNEREVVDAILSKKYNVPFARDNHQEMTQVVEKIAHHSQRSTVSEFFEGHRPNFLGFSFIASPHFILHDQDDPRTNKFVIVDVKGDIHGHIHPSQPGPDREKLTQVNFHILVTWQGGHAQVLEQIEHPTGQPEGGRPPHMQVPGGWSGPPPSKTKNKTERRVRNFIDNLPEMRIDIKRKGKNREQ